MWITRIADLPLSQLSRSLETGQLELDLGALRVAVRSEIPELAPVLQQVYGEYPVVGPSEFVDVRCALLRGQGLRRAIGRQVRFFMDGTFPFEPFPVCNHLPFLEWGMNWGIAHRSNNYLLLHAGVIERNACGVVLSALPGSGKSTLTAALVASGYRHFSDEFGVLRLADRKLIPLLRPIALKNESVAAIRRFGPDMTIGPLFRGTRKGDVAHAAPNAASVARRNEPATPRIIIFPKFVAGAATKLEVENQSRAFSRLSVNSFNYELLGPASFEALADMVSGCCAYSLRYSDLQSAVSTIDQLVTEQRATG